MGKQSQVTERTRNSLIKSFWNLYKSDDTTKITIRNICCDANYDRTSFYRYFRDIDDILEKIEDDVISNIKESIIKRKNAKETSSILFEGFNNFSNNYGEYVVVFQKKGNNNFYNKFKKLVKEEVYNYFHFNIKDENKKEIVFELLFSSLISSYSYWFNHKDSMPLETYIEFANSIISNGINTIIKK